MRASSTDVEDEACLVQAFYRMCAWALLWRVHALSAERTFESVARACVSALGGRLVVENNSRKKRRARHSGGTDRCASLNSVKLDGSGNQVARSGSELGSAASLGLATALPLTQ